MSDERVNETMLLIMQRVPNIRVFRQNVAKLPDRTGRWIQFGVPGMADIGGIAGPEGWRVEIEMKPTERKAHQSKKTVERQRRWRAMIDGLGGIYILARGENDAVDQLIAALEERRCG